MIDYWFDDLSVEEELLETHPSETINKEEE